MQITVLTMYTGQMFLLRRLMPKSLYEGVRVTPVDNFQGEENDIILLSLVRSNELGRIGFLQIHNRVCVALSRARKGLYVIGNMDQMADASGLWNGIVRQLKAAGQLVDALPLACQNHPDNVVLASKAEDFGNVPDGGCMLDCGYRLSCGHVCTRKCHPTDRLHEDYVCRKPCRRKTLCENDEHRCRKRCFEACGRCEYMVEKTVPGQCVLSFGLREIGSCCFSHCFVTATVTCCCAFSMFFYTSYGNSTTIAVQVTEYVPFVTIPFD